MPGNYHAGRYFDASMNILEQIAQTVEGCSYPVNAYIAGGQAVAFWLNGLRMSLDLDVLFSHKMSVAQGLHALVVAEDPLDAERVDFDYNFNSTFSLIHDEYPERARKIATLGMLEVYVLAPVDLALMKLSRFSDRDRNDIKQLIAHGLLVRDELRDLAEYAIHDYVGNIDVLKNTLDIVLDWFPVQKKTLCRLRP